MWPDQISVPTQTGVVLSERQCDGTKNEQPQKCEHAKLNEVRNESSTVANPETGSGSGWEATDSKKESFSSDELKSG